MNNGVCEISSQIVRHYVNKGLWLRMGNSTSKAGRDVYPASIPGWWEMEGNTEKQAKMQNWC